MAKAIEFEVERLLGRLNALEGTQIKYAGGQAMKRLGFGLREHHALQMAGRFENPVPFTLSSPRYQADGLDLRVFISRDGAKGQDPGRYLYPTDRGSDSNTAYTTRFGRALQREGITNRFPVPYIGGRGVRTNTYGNMQPGQYTQVLAGLKRNDGTYFSIPDARRTSSRTTTLKPGIYQRKGRGLNMLFAYLNTPPSVRQAYDFESITRRYAEQQLPKLLREELAKALR